MVIYIYIHEFFISSILIPAGMTYVFTKKPVTHAVWGKVYNFFHKKSWTNTSQVHQPLRTEEKCGPGHSDRADVGGSHLVTVFFLLIAGEGFFWGYDRKKHVHPFCWEFSFFWLSFGGREKVDVYHAWKLPSCQDVQSRIATVESPRGWISWVLPGLWQHCPPNCVVKPETWQNGEKVWWQGSNQFGMVILVDQRFFSHHKPTTCTNHRKCEAVAGREQQPTSNLHFIFAVED